MPPQVHDRFDKMEKSIGEVQRAQEKAMDIFEGFAEEQKSIDEKLAMVSTEKKQKTKACNSFYPGTQGRRT